MINFLSLRFNFRCFFFFIFIATFLKVQFESSIQPPPFFFFHEPRSDTTVRSMYGVYIYLYYKCKYTCGSVHRFLRALGLQTARNRNHKDSGWMSTAQMFHLGVFVYLAICLAFVYIFS
ncbi:hypothetical protein Dimus_003608 [Dionaea muscipula]